MVRKPTGVVLLMVMLACAWFGFGSAGSVMVSELTVIPSPKLAYVTPSTKLVPVAVRFTFSVCPWAPKFGAMVVISCALFGSAMMNAISSSAVSVPPPAGSVVTTLTLRAP